ncbi:MAG: DUF177 domain-containing protein [Candidatus Acidiferrales bacterium]
MFLDINELAVHKVRIHKGFAPGSIDFQTKDFRQIEAIEVRATAELVEGQIRVSGTMHTRLEMVCARCLDEVTEEISREFDLYYRPAKEDQTGEEKRLKDDDTEIGFFEGEGIFLTDILAEQVLLALPFKVICRSDCRGLCPQCGVNLNSEDCRCEGRSSDPRLAPLARLKQDWFKKQ